MCVEKIVLSRLGAEKAGVVLVDGLVLHVKELVVLPHGILHSMLGAITLNQSVGSFVRIYDGWRNIVISLVDANVAHGGQCRESIGIEVKEPVGRTHFCARCTILRRWGYQDDLRGNLRRRYGGRISALPKELWDRVESGRSGMAEVAAREIR